MVTTKGAGLNPNAKVWQEIPTPQHYTSEGTEGNHWLQTSHSSAEMTQGYSEAPSSGGKGQGGSGGNALVPPEGVMNGHGEIGYPLFDQPTAPAMDGEVSVEAPLSAENLRESLKKQLEFCFSRENLSKDLYLISQMDSDQFVPIWTIACMEDIKVLTTDMDLILDVLRASPMVQVDDAGEKVRPSHKRCIIILREVPESTPVEEVQGLFKNDNCPKVISVEFAHNNNWYITFQSDTDAQQAYRYLREEVKMFQGKPIMARIKAINTFFAKNGYRNVDSSVYNQNSQPQSQYGSSSMYMQQVYNPQQQQQQQQQYPVYPLVAPSWNTSVTPYFETPLAPFPNSGFVNAFSSTGTYKAGSNSMSVGRTFNRTQNLVKTNPRPGDVTPSPSVAPVPLMDSLPGPSSPQSPNTTGVMVGTTPEPGPVCTPSLTLKDTLPLATIPNGDLSMAGRGRRGSYRGMRRRREDERLMKPVPQTEVKALPPKFDLEASNFPPLPGCVVSTQGESILETRLSDVVRGIKVPEKSENKEVKNDTPTAVVPEADQSRPNSTTPAPISAPVTSLIVVPPVPSVTHEVKKVDIAEPSIPKETISSSQPMSPCEPSLTTKPLLCGQPVSTAAVPFVTSAAQEPRKLSYAEICQRPAKDPPVIQPPSPTPPASSANQPLRELGVNKVEDSVPSTNHTDKPEKSKDSRPPRNPLGSYRGGNGPARGGGAGLKFRENQRAQTSGRWFSPQRGPRRSGKEQNIPPRSPK